MNPRTSILSTSMGLVLSMTAGVAQAHVRLDSPTPRYVYTDTGIKTSPCASGTHSNVVTHLTPGQSLTVMFTETIFHPGFFRISLDTTGADAFPAISKTPENPVVAPVLADNVLPHTTGTAPIARMFTVTVPNTTCTKCTLQLTQFMSDNPTSGYYECADVTIGASSPDAGASDAGASSAGTGGKAGSGGTSGGAGGAIGTGGGAGGERGLGGAAAVGTGGATGAGTGVGGATGDGGNGNDGAGGAYGTGGAETTGTGGALAGGSGGSPDPGGIHEGGCAYAGTRSHLGWCDPAAASVALFFALFFVGARRRAKRSRAR